MLSLWQIATALFANSPFKEGKPNGFFSMRRYMEALTQLFPFTLCIVKVPYPLFICLEQPYLDWYWQGSHRHAAFCFWWLFWVRDFSELWIIKTETIVSKPSDARLHCFRVNLKEGIKSKTFHPFVDSVILHIDYPK